VESGHVGKALLIFHTLLCELEKIIYEGGPAKENPWGTREFEHRNGEKGRSNRQKRFRGVRSCRKLWRGGLMKRGEYTQKHNRKRRGRGHKR